jgi:glycosyltransferase involved in cell wall biosynthesis
VEWLIIDNGCRDPVEDFVRHTLKPKRLNYIKNSENLGMVATYNQIFNLCTTDLLAVLHNDVFIYEKGWDKRICQEFTGNPKLGLVGLFGSQGVGSHGERIQDRPKDVPFAGLSNMLEANVHGMLLTGHTLPVAIIDGFAMIFRQTMIRQAGGLDPRYQYHHLYDRELSLISLALGYQNLVINIPCHHVSSLTANQPQYQAWIDQQVHRPHADQWTHDTNAHYFAKKWASSLPLYIEADGTFKKGRSGQWNYKGDAILTARI